MPLFRLHRGGLAESLATTIVVKTLNDVVRAVVMSLDDELFKKQEWGARFSIEPYPSAGKNFDPRIGWFTQIVLCNLYEKDKMHPVGFLSEPLEVYHESMDKR